MPITRIDPISGSLIDGLGSSLLLSQSPSNELPNSIPNDSTWIMRSFIVTSTELTDTDAANRSFSSAYLKYSDSSLGGNHAINPPPQFTRYADPRVKGMRASGVKVSVGYIGGSIGMGRYYSEAIDDNKQIIHMRFGVPSFNSMTQFLTGFYSTSAATLARRGRVDKSFIEKFLTVGGNIIGLAIAPLFIIPLAIVLIGTVSRFFLRWPASKYYYLSPSMPAYWSAVSNMVNQIAVNKGMISYTRPDQVESIIGKEQQFTSSDYSIFKAICPEFSVNGMIDVKAVATKTKRLQMRHEFAMAEAFEKNKGKDFYGIVRQVLKTDHGGTDKPSANEPRSTSLESYWQRFLDTPVLSKMSEKLGLIEKSPRVNAQQAVANSAATNPTGYSASTPEDGFATFFGAELADGASWVSFKVDYTGQTSESFNNSFAQSGLAQKINSVSSSARELRLNMADGNILGGINEAIVSGVGDVLRGVADVLHIDGLFAAAGNAFIDIPEHWENSTASLSSTNYTMTLISPYGNAVSQMFNIYIPLCCILAGGMPLSTGKQSYTSPFLCEIYDKGRCMTRLGMISSISVTRGTSNLGFNNEGHAMAIDVSFSIKDLSSIVSMPINPGFSIIDGLFDSENAFSDYMMALSAMELKDIVNRLPMLKYQIGRARANLDSFLSASNIASWSANLPGVHLLGAIARGTDRK